MPQINEFSWIMTYSKNVLFIIFLLLSFNYFMSFVLISKKELKLFNFNLIK